MSLNIPLETFFSRDKEFFRKKKAPPYETAGTLRQGDQQEALRA
jgi:hypothetical protein